MPDDLTGAEIVQRFQDNEGRIDTFVNTPTGYYVDRNGTHVETIQAAMARWEIEISGPIVEATANYVLSDSDKGKHIVMNMGSGNTVTLPSGLSPGFFCRVSQKGAGQTIITASGTTLRNKNGLKTSGQYARALIEYYNATDTYLVSGDTST